MVINNKKYLTIAFDNRIMLIHNNIMRAHELLKALVENPGLTPVGMDRDELIASLDGISAAGGGSRSKWGNQPVNDPVHGHFDSTGEYNRYLRLLVLQEHGLISDLERQPPYVLQDKFTEQTGVKHRAIQYVADFRYRQGDLVVIEDFKGAITEQFAMKYKMFLQRYPSVNLFVNYDVNGLYCLGDMDRLRYMLRGGNKKKRRRS